MYLKKKLRLFSTSFLHLDAQTNLLERTFICRGQIMHLRMFKTEIRSDSGYLVHLTDFLTENF